MVTVAHLVEKMIEQKPFIQEALSRGIINNAALAEELLPDIEKELRQKVKFSAVNMAIRRLGEKLGKNFVTQAKFNTNSDITVKSDLVEITIYKTAEFPQEVKKIYELMDFRKGDLLTITQGLNEVMIITNKKHLEKITAKLPFSLVKKIIKNVSSVTINLTPAAAETLGLFYLACRALNWENINIVDIVSTFTEMTFIFKEEDAAKALETL